MRVAELNDLVLKDSFGSTVRLASMWAQQPAVVVWLRHYG